MEGEHPLPYRYPLTMPRSSEDYYAWGNSRCQKIVGVHKRRGIQRILALHR